MSSTSGAAVDGTDAIAPAADERLNPLEEASRVRALWKTRISVREVWCLLDAKWFRSWCAYTGFKPSSEDGSEDATSEEQLSGVAPGPIDNMSLSSDKVPEALRPGIAEHEDYAIVLEEVNDLLVRWHGGGVPKFDREVIQTGLQRINRLDLYPSFIRLVSLDDKGEPDETNSELRRFGTKQSLDHIVSVLEKERQSSVRLWIPKSNDDMPNENSTEPNGVAAASGDSSQNATDITRRYMVARDLSIPLEVMQLEPGTVFWVDEKTTDGKWRRSHIKQNFRDYEVGDIVDAQDSVGKWYESSIMEIKPETKQVFVHFIGWPKKWDEWLPFDSERITKQNTYTTGPRKPKKKRSHDSYMSSYNSSDRGTPAVRGAVGLRNLGNTCFMNSMLQCLSNTPGLTDYFLDDSYLHEINRENPLGCGGKIAEEYGALLKDLWSGEYRVVSPVTFKQRIGEFAPRFSGYQQHDSSELLSFLLDGLHEDLNQVRDKPYTQAVEANGREDTIVARESWDVYLQRNRSIIVDTLQGQLKSTLVCPKCDRVSITFDPYMYLSVPLPQIEDKLLPLTFIFADPVRQPLEVAPLVSKVGHIASLKDKLSEMLDVPAARMIIVETWHGTMRAPFRDDDSVADIRSTDVIYVYEVPEIEELNPSQYTVYSVPNYFLRTSNNTRSKATKYPFLFVADKTEQLDTDGVKRKLEPWINRHIVEGAPDNAYVIVMTDMRGTYCANCPLHSNCGGCALPKSPVPVENFSRTRNLMFGVQWNQDGQFFDDDSLKIEQHESVTKNRDGGARAAELSLTLGKCLEAYTQQEVLGVNDAWYCNVCKEHVRASKKFDVWSLPDVLVVHLKRFSYSRIYRDKITTYVDFPDELDMSQYCVNPEANVGADYELYAVSNHMGAMGGGHYTAYCRNLLDGKWYSYDDSYVREMRADDIRSSSAYVLFYRRKSNRRSSRS